MDGGGGLATQTAPDSADPQTERERDADLAESIIIGRQLDTAGRPSISRDPRCCAGHDV